MTLKEKLANKYANEPNSVDKFTLMDKLMMRAAYIAGFDEAVRRCADKCPKCKNRKKP